MVALWQPLLELASRSPLNDHSEDDGMILEAGRDDDEGGSTLKLMDLTSTELATQTAVAP